MNCVHGRPSPGYCPHCNPVVRREGNAIVIDNSVLCGHAILAERKRIGGLINAALGLYGDTAKRMVVLCDLADALAEGKDGETRKATPPPKTQP